MAVSLGNALQSWWMSNIYVYWRVSFTGPLSTRRPSICLNSPAIHPGTFFSEAPMRRWKHSPAPSKPLSEAMDPWFLMISGADQWENGGKSDPNFGIADFIWFQSEILYCIVMICLELWILMGL